MNEKCYKNQKVEQLTKMLGFNVHTDVIDPFTLWHNVSIYMTKNQIKKWTPSDCSIFLKY